MVRPKSGTLRRAKETIWGKRDGRVLYDFRQVLKKFGRNNGISGVGFGCFLKALSQSEFTSHVGSG